MKSRLAFLVAFALFSCEAQCPLFDANYIGTTSGTCDTQPQPITNLTFSDTEIRGTVGSTSQFMRVFNANGISGTYDNLIAGIRQVSPNSIEVLGLSGPKVISFGDWTVSTPTMWWSGGLSRIQASARVVGSAVYWDRLMFCGYDAAGFNCQQCYYMQFTPPANRCQ